jgi:hypothetical protein
MAAPPSTQAIFGYARLGALVIRQFAKEMSCFVNLIGY